MSKTERYVLTSALAIVLVPKLEALGIAKADQPTVLAAAAILIPSLYHVAAGYLEQRAAKRNPSPPAPVPARTPPA
jgi:hypothetical protein